MKRFIMVVILVCFIAFSNNTLLAQGMRFFPTYRIHEWLESSCDSLGFTLHFPQSMSPVAAKLLPVAERIHHVYSRFFTVSLPVSKDSVGNPVFSRESVALRDAHDVLYPTPPDFHTGQRILPGFIPFDVAGFTEFLGNRTALFYGGDLEWFQFVYAHEKAHQFMNYFIRFAYQKAADNGKNLLESGSRSGVFGAYVPIWFSEGLAEYLAERAFGGAAENYRSALREFANLRLAANPIRGVPSFDEITYARDFRPYSVGYDAVRFFAQTVSEHRLVELLKLFAWRKSFKKAFADTAVYGRPLDDFALEWARNFRAKYNRFIYGEADYLPQREIFHELRRINRPIGFIRYHSVDNRLAYFTPDRRSGVRMVVFDGEVIPVADAFAGKTLPFRLDNPPAFSGDTVAVPVWKNGKDIIQVFLIDFHKRRAALIQELQFANVVWISDAVFGDDSHTLYFTGIDTGGRKDIYRYEFSENALDRLTRDDYSEESLAYSKGDIFYVRRGIGFEHEFMMRDVRGTVFHISFAGEEGFSDQVVLSDSLVAVRMLRKNGVPDVIIWKKGSAFARVYRYGRVMSESQGKNNLRDCVRYTFVEQLLGFTAGGDLVIRDTDGTFWEVSVQGEDFKKLRETRVFISLAGAPEAIFTKQKFGIRSRHKRKFFMPQYNPRTGFVAFTFSDATGERRIDVSDISFSYSRSGIGVFSGVLIRGTLGYSNLSRRVHTRRLFTVEHFPSVRGPGRTLFLDYRVADSTNTTISMDTRAETAYAWTYPFNLEERFHFSVSGGFLWRDYLYSSRKSVTTPIVGVSTAFVRDGVFNNFAFGTSRGPYFHAVFVEKLGIVSGYPNILEGYMKLDARYYIQPWNSRAYFPVRVMYARSFGRDNMFFISPNLYRKHTIEGIDWRNSFGTEIFMYHAEARFPFLRGLFVDYEFWNSDVFMPFAVIDIIPSAFAVGGTVKRPYDPYRFHQRVGFAINFNILFMLPIRLEWWREFPGSKSWKRAVFIDFLRW